MIINSYVMRIYEMFIVDVHLLFQYCGDMTQLFLMTNIHISNVISAKGTSQNFVNS